MPNSVFFTDANFHIKDILDIPKLTSLFQRYSDLTGVATGLLDLEGVVLIATNWQDACTQFHRTNELTCRKCHESDTNLAGMLAEGHHYNVYECKNGLVDVAMPIRIKGRHVGNLFAGQFFFDKPDLDYFKQQAKTVGFDQASYLDAIKRVPVYERNTITEHLEFLAEMAEIIGTMGAEKLEVNLAKEALEGQKANLQAIVSERTKDLKKALEKSEASSLAKSKFLSNMSHELRTPLAAVLGFSEILEMKETDHQKIKYLSIINQAGKGLLSLVNSVLDLAKIESGRMAIELEPVVLPTLIRDILSIFSRQAAEKDIELQANMPDAPLIIRTDETKLKQILINLVGNAVKFTDRGHVTLSVEAVISPCTTRAEHLAISVADSGKGIDYTDQATIFDAFEQAKQQRVSDYGGTGLGLALSREFAHLLHGALSVRSEPGKGSIFTCSFSDVPLETGAVSATNSRGIELGDGGPRDGTILVIDDNQINRDLIETYLKHWSFQVVQAANGLEGLEAARKLQPDLIMMDMKMPVMDGFEATRRLKDDTRTQHIPVIAATASALLQEKELIINITDDYLAKPIDIKELCRIINRFFQKSAQRADTPKQILIVDDVSSNRQLLQEILSDLENFEITTAHSGQLAIEAACQLGKRPDIILMDYEMPGINGIDAARQIRQWERDQKINNCLIYSISASRSGEDITVEQGIFDGKLHKPFDISKICEVLGPTPASHASK